MRTNRGVDPEMQELLEREARKHMAPKSTADESPSMAEVPVEYSEIELARRFVANYSANLRYCAGIGRWLEWSGQVWRFDETMHAFDLARGICREASQELQRELQADEKDARKAQRAAASIAQASTVAAVEKLARADREHAITVADLDSDPWMLNTKSGMVDLRTTQLLPHDPKRYCTKMTGAGVGTSCDLWRQFLADITDSNVELIEFLQRIVGYCLTGDVSEHALFFAHGPGGNGKSVFINTVRAMLGDYATVAAMDTFVVSGGDKHPTDLAMLRGARLAVATETEEGRRWAESKIKALTGGDPISARFMRQDFFEFMPQFKLFVVGNHKPAIRNVDDAMRRRMHLLPFTFKPTNPDKRLPEKLHAELDGILAWALEGCRAWQQQGLAPPTVVRQATEDYFAVEDALGRWLDECIDVDGRHREIVGTQSLFENWKAWAEVAGEFVGSMKRFSENMKQRGFEHGKHWKSRQSGFSGLKLLDSVSRRAA